MPAACRKGVLLISLGSPSDDRQSSLAMTMSGQARALTSLLPEGWCVLTAIHGGQPDIGSVIRQVEADGINELTVVPMHPHFSRDTTGAIMRELYHALAAYGLNIDLVTRSAWGDELGYVNAQARMLAEFAISRRLNPGDAHVLFAAHSPISHDGRPDARYTRQVRRSAELVAERLGWPDSRVSLSFGNKPDSQMRLRPDANLDVARLLRTIKRKVILCHLTFPVNCWDLTSDIVGMAGDVHVCPALNAYGPFIAALKNIVLRG
ncbi:MAG: ferrochelatase, partial [Gemmatimonadota bacterium]